MPCPFGLVRDQEHPPSQAPGCAGNSRACSGLIRYSDCHCPSVGMPACLISISSDLGFNNCGLDKNTTFQAGGRLADAFVNVPDAACIRHRWRLARLFLRG